MLGRCAANIDFSAPSGSQPDRPRGKRADASFLRNAGHRELQVRMRLAAGAKEIRTLRPILNASGLRAAHWVPSTAPGFGVRKSKFGS
jgi:hypothetical protein